MRKVTTASAGSVRSWGWSSSTVRHGTTSSCARTALSNHSKTQTPLAPPDQLYKALAADKALHAWASPDGIHWRPLREEPVITVGKFDSQNVSFWDQTRERYVAFYRAMRGPDDELTEEGPQLGLDDNGPARDVMTCTSADFLNWTEPQWLQYPGAPREQIYLNQIRAYERAPHLFVGFPGRFMAAREIEKGLPATEHPAYDYASITETLFMSSRDGLQFKRWGEAFIRPGPRRERWIYGATFPGYGLLTTPSAIEGMPHELSMYVNDGAAGVSAARHPDSGATVCASTASYRCTHPWMAAHFCRSRSSSTALR